MKKTLAQIIALFCIELIILLPFYTVNALTVSNVQVADVTENSAAVSWVTDEDSTSIVHYGINSILNQSERNESFAANHTIMLRQLVNDEIYGFVASSCDAENNCANSTKQNFTSGSDTTPPELDVIIPEFVNAAIINIIGKTEPFSEIRLFVNDLKLPARFLDSSRTSTGAFEFFNIALQKENLIKITAKDTVGNQNEKTFRVSVDTEDPEVVLDKIPGVTRGQNISIVGTVNEPATINAFLTRNGSFVIPEKITGLNAEAGNDSVELAWDEVKVEGFSHYVIYRNDIPIAATKPESYNTFTDLLVNSEFTYTYQVTAVTISGKEGPKSDPVTAAIPAGGKKGISEPEPIDILQET